MAFVWTRRTHFSTGRRHIRLRSNRSLARTSFITDFERAIPSCNIHCVEENDKGNHDNGELTVKRVDLNIRGNTIAHRTNEFDITDASINTNKEHLVVRRGQEFDITVEFNREYHVDKDDLRFVFKFGDNPKPTQGTHVVFILSDKDLPQQWGGYIKSSQESRVCVTLITPPSCYVGKWTLSIDVVKKNDVGVEVSRWQLTDPIYMLFNPWCKADLVYFGEKALLEEYVLNETGKIYSGSSKKISPKPWVFGQFTGDVLDCCVYLLDNCGLSDKQRGNPVLIARKISSFVNAPDDNGVLEGNWSGNYSAGVSPLNWTGSVAILEQYYNTKRPVKFGQCWVFSGVVTTVCRALGIPARSVTNFDSAHDTNASVSIDYHFKGDGDPLPDLDEDSIWNFHVWNDVWMARPDLPEGYGGWQAIDATPQERSDSVFCMGPASLVALKRGEVHLPYDGQFAFAEVNADKLYWIVQGDASVKLAHKESHGVGRFISTKRPCTRSSWSAMADGPCPDREDITNQYKFKEGSDEERASVRRANLTTTNQGAYETGDTDVTFDFSSDDDTFLGETVKVFLKLTNTSDDSRTVSGSVNISTMFYTGVPHKEIVKVPINRVLAAKEEAQERIEIESDRYLEHLVDHCMLKLACMCIVTETRHTFAQMDKLRLRKPRLTIKAPDTGTLGEEFEVEVSFVNETPLTLSGAELRVEGPGIQKPTPIKLWSDRVRPKKTFVKTLTMTSAKLGEREIVIYFNCIQMSAVTASHVINIKK